MDCFIKVRGLLPTLNKNKSYFRLVELFGSLWHIALEFHEKYERWYNGPLTGLDAESIHKQVRLIHTKCLRNLP